MKKMTSYPLLSLIFTLFNILNINALYSQSPTTTTAPTKEEAPQKEELKTYVNKEKKYEVQYPKSWQTRAASDQFDLVLVAPPKPSEKQISATMNLLSEHVGSALTLDQFFNENIPNVMTELKEAKIEDSGTQSLNGVTSKWALYTHRMNDLDLKVLQYFIIANERAYLITFSTINDEFPLYKNEFDDIAASFRLLKSPPSASLRPQSAEEKNSRID